MNGKTIVLPFQNDTFRVTKGFPYLVTLQPRIN
jgi:hypothetical protein